MSRKSKSGRTGPESKDPGVTASEQYQQHGGIQNLLKETIVEFMENRLDVISYIVESSRLHALATENATNILFYSFFLYRASYNQRQNLCLIVVSNFVHHPVA